MKLALTLIIVGVLLAIERSVGFTLSFINGEFSILYLVTLPIYSGLPLYFGIRRLVRIKTTKEEK